MRPILRLPIKDDISNGDGGGGCIGDGGTTFIGDGGSGFIGDGGTTI
jgi:hypothetical protein